MTNYSQSLVEQTSRSYEGDVEDNRSSVQGQKQCNVHFGRAASRKAQRQINKVHTKLSILCGQLKKTWRTFSTKWTMPPTWGHVMTTSELVSSTHSYKELCGIMLMVYNLRSSVINVSRERPLKRNMRGSWKGTPVKNNWKCQKRP